MASKQPSLLPRLQSGEKKKRVLWSNKQSMLGREQERSPLRGLGRGSCPYTGTFLSRGLPGPRGRGGFLAGLWGRRRPRGGRGSAQPRSLCVSEDSSMKARFSLG